MQQPTPLFLHPATNPPASSWWEKIRIWRGKTTGYRDCGTFRFWEERIRDRNVLNTATPPALCKLWWRSLEARAAPGRALTPSLSTSQSTGKYRDGCKASSSSSPAQQLWFLPMFFICLETWHKIQPPSSSHSGGPHSVRQKCSAFCSILQKNWGPCLEDSNDSQNIWRLVVFLFYVFKKAYSCFITDFSPFFS